VEGRVEIECDSRANYGKVVDVVDNLRAAGVDNLGLLTEQLQEKGKTATPDAAAPVLK